MKEDELRQGLKAALPVATSIAETRGCKAVVAVVDAGGAFLFESSPGLDVSVATGIFVHELFDGTTYLKGNSNRESAGDEILRVVVPLVTERGLRLLAWVADSDGDAIRIRTPDVGDTLVKGLVWRCLTAIGRDLTFAALAQKAKTSE